jgi:hypothetical protein
MLVDHAKSMRRVCFDAKPSETDLQLLGSRERWLVYRDLVRKRLSNVIGSALPRTRGAIGESAFGRAVDEWFGTGGPKTRYLRHVPSELARFVIPIWQDTEAPWVSDLARYEIAEWEVRHAPPNRIPEVDLAFDRRPVIATAVQVLRLAHPVHQKPTPQAGCDPDPTILCLYRDVSHRPVSRKLNPLAADLLETWKLGDRTLAESVKQVAATHGTEIGPAFVEKLSAMIADFIDCGIILGGRLHSPQ